MRRHTLVVGAGARARGPAYVYNDTHKERGRRRLSARRGRAGVAGRLRRGGFK